MKYSLLLLFIISVQVNYLDGKINTKNVVIDGISDIKELKKLFRTKNNVMVLYLSQPRESQSVLKTFTEAAEQIKGQGTMVTIDCSDSETKKLCKKLKINPQPVLLKHYKDGDFHKDYDRQQSVPSIVNFMRDPTGDLPWDEDPAGVDVMHIQDAGALTKILKRESRSIMVMFYAPWCGFCKTLKPEYAGAATELKPKYIMAAMDVNKPENSIIRKQYNITGFPTMLYYENGLLKYTYEGENNKAGLISFMKNPLAPPLMKPKEADWATEASSEIVHLTSTNFEPALKDEKSVLVMFYAPWCGHCKRMKPEYEKAAEIMKNKNIPGVLAALDATKESAIGTKFGVKGYPTVKFFTNGEFKFDVNVRDADKIIEFMKNPAEPPPPPPAEIPWEDEPSEVVHLNEETFKPFLKKKKHALVMFYAPWCGHCKKAKPEFVKAAEIFKENPRTEIAAIDCTKHASTCAAYNVKGYPTIKYFSYLKTVREYSGGRTGDDFIKYMSDPDGNVVKEEPFGDFTGSNKVFLLSDDDFDKRIKSADRMLVMFHAPWCGNCKVMKPAFSQLAAHLDANVPSTKAAAVDCTVHRITQEKFDIQAFPTLKYFEKGQFKSDYKGRRTFEDMLSFIMANGNEKTEL